MLRKFAITLGALALPFAAMPAMAQGKGLECMANAYTAEEQATMAELGPQVDYGDGANVNPAANAILEMSVLAVERCMSQRGWTEDQVAFATLYEMGRVNEIAYRASGALSEEEMRLLDEALATGNRDRLWEAIDRSLGMGFAGDDADPAMADSIVMGTFILGAGLPDDEETAVKIGLLLGWIGLKRMGAREFAALQ